MAAGFYAAPLAAIHDEAFGLLARAGAAELLVRLDAPSEVVELGCGSGITAAALLAAGHTVVGVDVSADMLELARRRAPDARLIHGSAADVALGPCDAVAALGEVLGYAPSSPESLAAVFERCAAALRPGGLLLFDLATPGRGSYRRVTEDAGWQLEFECSEEGATLTRSMTIRHSGGVSRERHALHLHDPERVEADLAAAGFRASRLGGYADLAFGRGHAGWAAVRCGPCPATPS